MHERRPGQGEGFAVDASVIRAMPIVPAACGAPRSSTGTRERARAARGGREYLAALGRQPVSEDPSEPPDSPAAPKIISLTTLRSLDRCAAGILYAYSTNYLIDLQAGIIVDVEATPAHRTQEVDSTRKMIDRVEERFDLKPHRLVGDTAYGTAPMLGWMVEDKHIAPHVPVWDKTERKDDTLSSSAFEWNPQANEYTCPQGHALRSDRRHFKIARERVTKADTVIYRSSQNDCKTCSMKHRCSPTHQRARSRAASTRAHETSPARSRPLPSTCNPGVIARRGDAVCSPQTHPEARSMCVLRGYRERRTSSC